MRTFELDALLAPMTGDAGDASCGVDLVYDPAFMALGEAARGKPEQQYGDTLIAAIEPDWRQIHSQSLQLASRSRDLRVALWLLRSSIHQDGVHGALTGFELVQGLLERHWPHVHPQLDAEDHDDPTERLNALAPLAHPAEVLADLRGVYVTRVPLPLRLRDLELAFNRNDPAASSAPLGEDGALQALADAEQRTPGLLAALQALERCARSIDQRVETHVGAGLGPDMLPLHKFLHLCAEAARRAADQMQVQPTTPSLEPLPETSRSSNASSITVSPPTLGSRADAARELGRIADWIEHNEPGHPAPLFIRRAQRLMDMSFLDIMRDLVPDSIAQIEHFAGPNHE
ncbi:MAG: type VI secretion system protein TssA [Leptothrix ochracea]|uniref:type VI secretion system protein TssA n=1 Tax=Leptothrix ochracea TaxID=735331 RepID=UPI0034E2E0CF